MTIETAIGGQTASMPPARRFAFPTKATFLSQAALLEEAGPPRAPALACLLGFVFVCVGVVAGMLVEIDVVTTSTGRIVASGGNQVLQSFDGGIVDQVLVEEGQVVENGDLLMTLRDPDGRSQLDRLMIREAALTAQAQRLQTLTKLPAAYPTNRRNQATEIVNEQLSILPLERNAMRTERSLAQAEIDRRSKAIANLSALEKTTQLRLSLIEDKLSMERQLFSKDLSPRAQLLEVEQEATDARFDLTELHGQIREARASLVESERRLDNLVADRRLQQGDRLSSLLIELNETRQQIVAMRQRLKRGQIVSITRGIILELKVRHPGQMITPGDLIVEIIPIDDGLVAETRLPPSEIGHVRQQQPVRIAIDGIEPHRYGYIQGEIASVSPSTFLDENALPYYRASIDLESQHLGDIPLTPGMTVQAQIKTGQRTMLEYLLKPVYRAWETAFRER